MFTIKVTNKTQAEAFGMTRHDFKTAVISIHSCKTNTAFIIPNDASGVVDVLVLEFNDTDMNDNISGGITRKDAILIANFLQKHLDANDIDMLLIHCEAGQSRSAGIAAAISKCLIGTDEEYFASSKYTPNMLCYRTVMNELASRTFAVTGR